MRVLESALPATLKPTAAALALFADETGHRIFPSVALLAWLLGLSTRVVQRQLSRLRGLGVLDAQTALTGGRGHAVRYRMDVEALPSREPYKRRRYVHGFETQNHDASVTVTDAETTTSAAERVTSAAERVTLMSQNPDASVTRSVSDPPIRSSKDQSGIICAPDGAPVSPTKTENPERKFSSVLDIMRTTHPQLARRWDEDRRRRGKVRARA